MHPKQVFWIGAKGGLCEEKHYRCMRDSVWLFLWLLLRQTGVNEIGEGVVNYGHPITRMQIQDDTGYHERRLEDWIDLLRRTGYIRTESRNKEGLIFFVKNAKDKQRKSGGKVFRAVVLESRKYGMVKAPPSRKNGTVPLKRDSQSVIINEVKSVVATPIPKDLSYGNKDTAATPAAGVPSIKSLVKSKVVPKAYISQTEAKARAKKQIADLDRWLHEHPTEVAQA
jgi:ribosomal protein L14